MTPRISGNVSGLLVDWSLVTIIGNTLPPRIPDDDDDEDEEENEEDEDEEPAVIREPDE